MPMATNKRGTLDRLLPMISLNARQRGFLFPGARRLRLPGARR